MTKYKHIKWGFVAPLLWVFHCHWFFVKAMLQVRMFW